MEGATATGTDRMSAKAFDELARICLCGVVNSFLKAKALPNYPLFFGARPTGRRGDSTLPQRSGGNVQGRGWGGGTR